jgi:hypothetical protein
MKQPPDIIHLHARTLLIALLLASGCRTTSLEPLDLRFTARAQTLLATVQWRGAHDATPLHADAVIQFEAPHLFQLVAFKGPMRLLTLQMSDERWRAEFPSQNRVLSGNDPQRAPSQLQLWLKVRDAFAKSEADARALEISTPDGSTMHVLIQQRR